MLKNIHTSNGNGTNAQNANETTWEHGYITQNITFHLKSQSSTGFNCITFVLLLCQGHCRTNWMLPAHIPACLSDN
jgi:hypothetical protein